MDLKILGAEYGQAIPYLLGRAAIAGQMWWNTDRRPITTVTRSGGGGKGGGGGPPETETTSVTYEMDCLIGLTDNMIAGVARIWANGKLIWGNNSEDSSAETLAASASSTLWTRLTVYTGEDDQLPDPTYEAAVGVGNAPAYIGRGTVFIEGLQLGSSGAVPNLTFEVITRGDSGVVGAHYFDADINPLQDFTYDGSRYVLSTNGNGVYIFDTETRTFEILSAESFSDVQSLSGVGWVYSAELRTFFVGALLETGNDKTILAISLDARTETGRMPFALVPGDPIGGPASPIPLGISGDELLVALTGEFGSAFQFFSASTDEVVPTGFPTNTEHEPYLEYVFLQRPAFKAVDGTWWMRGGYDGTLSEIEAVLGVGNGILYRISDETDHGPFLITAFDGSDHSWVYDESRNCIYFLDNRRRYLRKFDCATQTVSDITEFDLLQADDHYLGYFAPPADAPSTDSVQLVYDSDEDRIYGVWAASGGAAKLLKIHPVTGAFESSFDLQPANLAISNWAPFNGFTYFDGALWGGSQSSSGTLGIDPVFGIVEIRIGILPECYTVAEVQAAVCERCGLSSSQYDVSGLTSITREVCSFPWSQVSPGREPTERLMSAYYYECTVSDKIYFRARGGAPVATLAYEELGAASEGSEPGNPLTLKLANDIELSAQIALTYPNLANDYQADTQYTDRLISATPGTVKAVQLALGFEPGEAKAVATSMLLDQVLALVTTQLNFLGYHCAIEPTDVVTATGADGSTYRLRIVRKRDSYPLISCDAVLDDASILTNLGITDLDYDSSTEVASPVSTVLEILDINILRDADDDPGFYLAVKGTGTPYAGSSVWKSTNAIDYTRIETINESTVIGETTTAMGNWTGPRIVDELNSVTVDVGAGTLSSTTRDLLLDTPINAMWIGGEIVQFRTATLVSPGVYTLTGLLRGCRGTEFAMTGHIAGERAILLRTAGIRRHVLSNAEVGLSRHYKGVTLGRALSSATAEAFTGNAVGLKPFSVFDLRASRDGSNDITFTWQRRSRLSVRTIGELGINVPLGEASEAYELDIIGPGSPTAVVRTISAATTTAGYTAAQQISDGITPGNPVTVRVYQISESVDRGYVYEATV
jgi:hypothetical protein